MLSAVLALLLSAGAADGGPAAVEPAPAPLREFSIDGLTARWQTEGNALLVDLDGATDGWVLIGFNDLDALAGSRLFFARVVSGKLDVQEHLAVPPEHRRVDRSGLLGLAHATERMRTRVRVSIPLGEHERVSLTPSRSYYVTLAWSMSDDFFHHSARREAKRITL